MGSCIGSSQPLHVSMSTLKRHKYRVIVQDKTFMETLPGIKMYVKHACLFTELQSCHQNNYHISLVSARSSVIYDSGQDIRMKSISTSDIHLKVYIHMHACVCTCI